MQNKLKFGGSAVAALGLMAVVGTAPAFAADAIMEAPPAPAVPMEEPPLNTWSGPYAGVTLGYGFAGETEVGPNSIDTDGFLLGGFAGYNWQVGNMVAGAEADIGYNWGDGSNAGESSESGVEGSLRARLGYVVSPNVLLYATAGGAAKDLEVSGVGGSDSNTMLGWTAGAGADVMVTENVFGRVEYRYTDFGSEDFTLGGATTDVSDKDHRINFGLGMKF
ncbi:MAG: porin family protein [Pseudomonadota bacterium]|nr:porin family protein [Pseudomonadota bacterium]